MEKDHHILSDTSIFHSVRNYFLHFALEVGKMTLYLINIFKQIFTTPMRFSEISKHLETIGVQSSGIILLTGFFTGAVFGLQIGGIFSIFRAEGLMGGATGIALATEMAPLVSGFLLTGRVGASMTSEIASMVVGEQIDALEAMGVDPINYLVIPRVIASMIMMPLLCGIFMFIGIVGSFFIGISFYEIDQGVFINRMIEVVKMNDVLHGLIKMFFFSIFISTLACISGLHSKGGAKGVGVATNTSVVKTLLLLLCVDFLISFFRVKWLS